MRYPENTVTGEWYLFTNAAVPWDKKNIVEQWKKINNGEPPEGLFYVGIDKEEAILGKKHYQVGRFSHIYLCLTCHGSGDGHSMLGCVDLTNRDFPEKWRELVSAGKTRVDMLNSLDAALGASAGTKCAQCNNRALEDDYLCGDCRGTE